MTRAAKSTLEDRIVATLRDQNSRLWFPELTFDLVESSWEQLRKKRIDKSNYSTESVVRGERAGTPNLVYSFPIRSEGIESIYHSVRIEILSPEVEQRYRVGGVKFYTPRELIPNESPPPILRCLTDGFDLIREIPSLLRSVGYLLRVIHIIKAESDEYDISFSEPDIPFSAFVSVPSTNSPVNAMRVAEGIVHEAMHLQLTLLERLITLVKNSDDTYFSPWKQEYRAASGLMHGLYVFRVIDDFLAQIAQRTETGSLSDYLTHRRYEIRQQVEETRPLASVPQLTSAGCELAHRLIYSG